MELLSDEDDILVATSLRVMEMLTWSASTEGATTLYSAVPAEDRNRATPEKKSATEIMK